MIIDDHPFDEKLLTDPAALYAEISERLQSRTPQTHRYADVPSKRAAVIIPIFFKAGEAHLLFTRRTDTVRHHKRQVSFPGGAYEEGDDSLEQTALRETWEEMGIRPDDLTILGQTDHFLTNTHFMVTPFVAHFPFPYPFTINVDEIDQIIEVPIRHLLHPENFSIREWERDGILWNIHYYDYEDDTIWGVTGFLLSNFLSIIFGITRMDDPSKII